MKTFKYFMSLFSGTKKYKKRKTLRRRTNKTKRKLKMRRFKMRGGWGGFIPPSMFIENKKDIQKGGWGDTNALN